MKRKKDLKEAYLEKSRQYMLAAYRAKLLHQWLMIEKKSISLADFFTNSAWKKIAVYGYGVVGKLLVKELLDENFQVPFIIDKKRDVLNTVIPTYSLADDLPECDVIVVTTNNLSEIKGQLGDSYSIILFEDILSLLNDMK